MVKCGVSHSIGGKEGYQKLTMIFVNCSWPSNTHPAWCIQWMEDDMLHISRDMQIFRCPQNWDASSSEHNLIDFAKHPARRMQQQQILLFKSSCRIFV